MNDTTAKSDEEILAEYEQRLGESWDRLAAGVRRMRDGARPEDLAQVKMAEEALYGDPTMCALLADNLAEKIGEGEPINAVEKFFLFWLLQRVHEDDRVALALVAGASASGRPKTGAKGLAVASSVFQMIMDGSARSVEQAWAGVADDYCISPDMVKRHWSRWKSVVLQACGLDEEALKARLVESRQKKGGVNDQ